MCLSLKWFLEYEAAIVISKYKPVSLTKHDYFWFKMFWSRFYWKAAALSISSLITFPFISSIKGKTWKEFKTIQTCLVTSWKSSQAFYLTISCLFVVFKLFRLTIHFLLYGTHLNYVLLLKHYVIYYRIEVLHRFEWHLHLCNHFVAYWYWLAFQVNMDGFCHNRWPSVSIISHFFRYL